MFLAKFSYLLVTLVICKHRQTILCICSAGTYLNKNGVFYLQHSYSSDINAKKRFTMDFSKITRLEAFGIAKY